ncbi:class I SAM-dependent methyltransferase [Chitinophaga sp.]|uniref:O-methyltransferase n=1 Tax=Chitinophaga sp. TaxID=1869181 RepID=UPI0026244FB6|nr:class I SAM-dependent methyltransferase [uncultured Chitinophaga sp.]
MSIRHQAALAKKYIRYYLTAGNRHDVHSPFIFTLVEEVLNKKGFRPAYEPMELLRRRLLQSRDVVQVTDLGAGSLMGASSTRRVSDIARHAAKPARFGQLFYRLVQHLGAKNVLELGTSLGLSTAYMASAGATVHTIEGCPNIAALAKMNFSSLGLDNIRQYTGNFDTELSGVLQQMPSPDIVYIDGNHREEPTVRYFEECLPYLRPDSIVIFDDVHWTEGMERAWETVKSHPSVTTTIDLFFIGIAFISPDFKAKQHFTIKF